MVTAGEPRSYPFGSVDRLELDPTYAALRSTEPVVRVRMPYGEDAWLATSYQDVRTVLSDPRFSRAASTGRDEPRMSEDVIQGGLLSLDPPEHTPRRRIVMRSLNTRRIEELRPTARSVADSLIAEMVHTGPPADVVHDFAIPLAAEVTFELLGMATEDRKQLCEWTDATLSVTTMSPAEVDESMARLAEYLAELINRHRRTPSVGLLGELVDAADNGVISEDQIVPTWIGVLASGNEAVTSQLSNFIYLLIQWPGLVDRLRTDPGLAPTLVEELTRFVPLGASASFARYALSDVLLGDVLIRAGEAVLPAIGSANLDPAAFERPEDLDPDRIGRPHLGFGHGPHRCPGAALAGMMLQVGLTALFGALPQLRFAVEDDGLEWKSPVLVRGLVRLPVSW
ncbi:cytochrome P450 [Actinoalloteichus hymeniacidonis]|uniref:Cytochrome P450 n=1 Tax=Actinoalloteichus hymeniacidonis TaxID=340345 RepID=A0AAC9MWQ1_9PSEU|nr:cytochrome P450 [Actinoalloteichus hymeniacidonis]AOS62458.1 cytochrome P450 [Actinoalloteichus hymeniacidonis]MBB5909511.1 cytochrome P450 [Actinoalloteichus hymeniacidonis]